MRTYPNFDAAIRHVDQQMRDASDEVRGTRWQSSDVSKKPEMRMREILNVSFSVALSWNENPKTWADDIAPNMPWAEDHFLERVGGEPLNPGVQWANWPYALSADKFRTEKVHDGPAQFSHTYMERYWPKHANHCPGGETNKHSEYLGENYFPHQGVRYAYGDLSDVVNHLLDDPLSRQAYLPIWFPEDTGVTHGERVPCTLGYHFIMRKGYLYSTYYIRSCDFVRHFRDDLYLSVRLQLWMLQELRRREGEQGRSVFWPDVKMGGFTFHCVSMHMFINDWNRLYRSAHASAS